MTTIKHRARAALVILWLTTLIFVGTFGQINPQITGRQTTVIVPSGIPTPLMNDLGSDG